MDQPQDWLSPTDRHAISLEAHQRFYALRAFRAEAPKDEDRASWCDRYAEGCRAPGVTGSVVSRWIDLDGWWKGTRRGVQLEVRWTRESEGPRGTWVEWRALAKGRSAQWLDGRSSSVMTALQDIGVDLSARLAVRYKAAQEEKRRGAVEEEAEAA